MWDWLGLGDCVSEEVDVPDDVAREDAVEERLAVCETLGLCVWVELRLCVTEGVGQGDDVRDAVTVRVRDVDSEGEEVCVVLCDRLDVCVPLATCVLLGDALGVST